jgi:hypothetical protein
MTGPIHGPMPVIIATYNINPVMQKVRKKVSNNPITIQITFLLKSLLKVPGPSIT